jgi:hypothetical protein
LATQDNVLLEQNKKVDKITVFSIVGIVVLITVIGISANVYRAEGSKIKIWDRNEKGVSECINTDHEIDRLSGVYALTEAARVAKRAEDGCLFVYSDEINSYRMVTKYGYPEKIQESFGTWTRDESGSIFITSMGATAPYEIKP